MPELPEGGIGDDATARLDVHNAVLNQPCAQYGTGVYGCSGGKWLDPAGIDAALSSSNSSTVSMARTFGAPDTASAKKPSMGASMASCAPGRPRD